MSFGARVFRILIASPSDVDEEREIAVATIQTWNDLNSAERQIVLLPLRWETHSAPEYGKRPQEVINRQIVDSCDLLVGIFWTRIGSPTGAADSGTLEEIERVASQGKLVMLYFSKVKQAPDEIDLLQLERLRQFKEQTFPKALVETYASQIEFRDKLAKQIEIQLRTLLAQENQTGEDVQKSTPITEIGFGFADIRTGQPLGDEIFLEATDLRVEDISDLPDYTAADKSGVARNGAATIGLTVNKSYYREMAAYLVRQAFFRPIRFWLKNSGGVGARDIYVDVRISAEHSSFEVLPIRRAGLSAPSRGGMFFGGDWSVGDDAVVDSSDKQRTTQFELRALQPQREVSPAAAIVVGSKKSGKIVVTARIYADTLSESVSKTLTINWSVNELKKSARELLQDVELEVPSSTPHGEK